MKTINTEAQEIQFKVILELPKNDKGHTIFPTDKSEESFVKRLSDGEIKDITFIDSGRGFGVIGVKIEVDSPELIEPKRKEVQALANKILRAEKPAPPYIPAKKTEYVKLFSFKSEGIQVSVERTIYPDNREFDVICLDGDYLGKIAKNVKNNAPELMKSLHFALPFSYGMFQKPLCVTMAQNVIHTKEECKKFVSELLKHTR